MAFNVNLYTFTKKQNSTARPEVIGVTCSCVIKEPCGILNPVIAINFGLSENPSARNYAYIPAFNRYYFVKEWIFQNALWYGTLAVDVLATWKTEIGASTCYVLRSSATYNGQIVDTLYPAKSSTYVSNQNADSPWETNIDSGMFVVGVAGQSTTYYLMTKTVLDLFFGYMFSDEYAALLTTNWSLVFPQLKAQSNPLQYITSIMWLPFMADGTLVETVRVGWVDVPVYAAYRVSGDAIRHGTLIFDIESHPQNETRGAYLDNAPYSTYSLFIPPWGQIRLDSDIMANSNTLVAWWCVDLRTGHGTLKIVNDYDLVMSWVHSQVGVSYQVSQVVNRGFGIGNLIAPALAVATSAATGNPMGIIAGVASGIGDAAASKVPSATTIGSNGGMDSLLGIPALQCEFKLIVDEDLDHLGRPLCTTAQIDAIPGYIKTMNPYIDTPATQTEKDSIISFMEGGFYYE